VKRQGDMMSKSEMKRRWTGRGCLLALLAAFMLGGAGVYWLLGSFFREVDAGAADESAQAIAEIAMDYFKANRRLPGSLQELSKSDIGSWARYSMDRFDPDFRIDPRSNGSRACVWLRPRKGYARGRWATGLAGDWDPKAPYPTSRMP
jgi:hypothetical protein